MGRVLRDGHQSVAGARLVVGAYDRQDPFILSMQKRASLSLCVKKKKGTEGNKSNSRV